MSVSFLTLLTANLGARVISRAQLITRGAALCVPLALPLHSAQAEAPDGCVTCKLKADLGAEVTAAVGDDVGALLRNDPPARKLAVREVVEVGPDPEKFDQTMRSVLDRYDPDEFRILVWVQSAFVNGRPWCPDTAAALPLLQLTLYSATGPPIVLVSADVDRREYASRDYYYRRHPQLRLTGVPTLYRWGRDGPVGRVQERQITPASLDALIGA